MRDITSARPKGLRNRRNVVAAGVLGVVAVAAPSTGVTAALAAPAVTQADGYTYAVTGSTEKIRPTQAVSSLGGSQGAVLAAARNEFAAFQVAISGGTSALNELHLFSNGPLVSGSNSIPTSAITLYREAYYDVGSYPNPYTNALAQKPSTAERTGGRWPDALIPHIDRVVGETRTAWPTKVPAKENRVAYIEILVPKNQPAGVYTGSVNIRADNVVKPVPITLTVRNFELPSTASLSSTFLQGSGLCEALNPTATATCTGDKLWKTATQQAWLALDNRVTISNPHGGPIMNDNNVDLFAKYTAPLVQGKAYNRLPGAALTGYQVSVWDAAELRVWKSLAQKYKFAKNAYAYDGTCDEPASDPDTRWAACRAKVNMIRATWPGLPNVITTNIDAVSAQNLALVDTITPLIQHLEDRPGQPQAGDQRKKYDTFLAGQNRKLWTYVGCYSSTCEDGPDGKYDKDPYFKGWPEYSIDGQGSQTRAMAWDAYRFGATGLLYYNTTETIKTAWTNQYTNGVKPTYSTNGDGNLFYPGTVDRIGGQTPVPLESLRLKQIRDGMQDYEYLKLAGAKNAAQTRAILLSLYPSTYQSVTTGPKIDSARAALAALIG